MQVKLRKEVIVARPSQNDTFLGNMFEDYIGDWFAKSGAVLASSSAVKAIALSVTSKKTLETLRTRRRGVVWSVVNGILTPLTNSGKLDRSTAQLMQRGLVAFFVEFMYALPEAGEPGTDAFFEKYKAALRGTLAKLKAGITKKEMGREVPAPPTTAKEAGAILTDAVYQAIFKEVGSDPDRFAVVMQVRSTVLSHLYKLALSNDKRRIDAAIAFDDGYFGNAATNLAFLAGVDGAVDIDDLMNKAIATILNLTAKDYTVKRISKMLEDAGMTIFDIAIDGAMRAPEYAKKRAVPAAKVVGAGLGSVFATSWLIIVISILAWLFFVFQGNMLAAALCTIPVLVAFLTINVIPVQIVGATLTTMQKTGHFAHMILAKFTPIPAPDPLKMRDLKTGKMTETDRYVIETRWRGTIAPMAAQLLVYSMHTLVWSRRPVVETDLFVFMIHFILLSIMIGVTLKFENMTEDVQAQEYYRLSRRWITILMIGALGAIVLGEFTGHASSAPLAFISLSGLEVGQHGLRQTIFQMILSGALVALTAAFVVTLWDLVWKKDSAGGMRMVVVLVLLLVLGSIHAVSVENTPLAEAHAESDQWDKRGLKNPIAPKDRPRGQRNTGSKGGGSNVGTTQETRSEALDRSARERRARIQERRRQRGR